MKGLRRRGREGGEELAGFLQSVQDQDRERAEEAKRLLAGRIS